MIIIDKKIKIEYDTKFEKLKAEYETKQKETLIRRNEVVQTEKEIEKENPEVLWQNEYDELMKSRLAGFFDELVDCLYSYGGNVTFIGKGFVENPEFQLDKDILAYADSNDLINYDRKTNHISLTDKGKYFVKQYQAKS